MKLYRSHGAAQGSGATAGQQSQQAGQAVGQSGAASGQQDSGSGQDSAGASAAQQSVQFTAEQQAAVDKIIVDRLKRAEEKWEAAQTAKAQAETDAAEAKRLADEKKYEELARKREAEAADLKAKLRQIEHDQLRRDVAQAAGIPQLWQRLQGETAEELTADAKALAAMMQPAAGQRTATTTPTPPAQGGQTDYVKQAIERQQKRATADDPYAAMMRS